MNPFPDFDSGIPVERRKVSWVDYVDRPSLAHYVGRPLNKRQLTIAVVAVFVSLLALLFRAGTLQILNGSHYLALAEGNRIRHYTLPAPRGIVHDRYGRLLTQNVPQLSLALIPFDVPRDGTERRALFEKIAGPAQQSADALETSWGQLSTAKKNGIEPVIIRANVPTEEGQTIDLVTRSLPGVRVLTTPRRAYPNDDGSAVSLSHVVGYVADVTDKDLTTGRYAIEDVIGKSGIEAVYDETLRGSDGYKEVEVDALGAEQKKFAQVEPTPGTNSWLTIDTDLQNVAEASFKKGLARAKVTKGAVIVLDPRNGQVLTMVSEPSFDADQFTLGLSPTAYQDLLTNPDRPLFNRAIQGRYPSGSIIKPVIAAGALEEGIITPKTSFLSTGGIRVGQWFFPDWKAGGHGITNVTKALADSVNTFFYIIGGGYQDFTGLGIEKIGEYARKFGLGSPTGIDLPGEVSGLIPDPAWKQSVKGERWYIGDTYHAAIGQGDILVTPIEMAAALSVLANGGTLYRPHLLLDSAGPNPVAFPDPKVAENVVSAATIAAVRGGLRAAVTSGSARYLNSLPVAVAGKTGTAELGGDHKPHAWFTGFAPYDKPQIVVVVLLEEAGEGSTYAVPVAHDIINWWAENRYET
ncbi:penicillin-binding protein 2 [Candidatus Uhrbacteria bacterium CG10_big_fil_rev_8_21_14_0_10_48_11]|uniref:Penicillin-binding protein 2 n=1 Tax=Candidatus Uhrbacteria bacterium CG10_big_fil_rev_8_21_14_0_10_48_11 TaxID=1975037 RepID=A0A2M8LE13_9BACT|nr:MAG: penicillin-binding protein 2 [Candidatus Uhrbacteria bacterium CG10_big_fil_rev_8_21_14_0_10_48_11]